MCFRPAEIEKKCPKCGATVDSFDTECPEYGQALETNMPGAPAGMPGAPMAPGAPAAPGVPKTPGVK